MLILHIIAGSFLLLFGICALCFNKGQSKHRVAGNLFFVSLLVMVLSVPNLLDDPVMAILSAYYGTTAWAIVLRKEKSTGVFEIVAMLTISMISIILFNVVLTSPSLTPTFKFILSAWAIVTALSALLDLNMIIRGGLTGKHRIARHAWRTCCALLGAVMSFSANTDKYWPDFVNSNILIYLTISVLVFWVFRILATKWFEISINTFRSNISIKMIFRR
ncbi:hypothetical protein [Paraglaciecola sp.]|uniref:hypothetical protein n=1 Tax=Paraglaciecola sp. TaxID=1920173 RepID=UPI0030F3B89D